MDFSSLFSRPPHSVDLMRPSGSPLSASGRDDGCQHAGIKRKRGTHGGEEEEEDDDTAEGNAEKLRRDSRTKKKSQGETQQLCGEARDRQNRSYQEELEEYLRVRVEQPERAGHQDRADEVQKPANGRPARQNPAQTGRGKKKKKKKKKKAANSQPQQGGHRHGNWNKKPPHLVKKPLMTPEFISQHAVEHKGQLICRYFLSGRCIKEDQCKFEHELVALEKKQEICKFYLQGYCTKGENCTYMHNEYPCKFFHTGTKCYQGDHCKFSHEPLTETTRPLLEKVLNKNEADVEKCDLQRGEDGTSSVRVPAVPLSGSLDRRPSFYNSSCPLDLGVHASWVSGAALDVQPVSSALPSSGFSRPQTGPAVAAGDGQFLRPDCSQPEASFPQGAHALAEIPEGQDLRDSPVLIPLQTLPGTMPRDPRQPCGAHLPVALPRPAFALCMEWLVEDCSSPGLQSFITGVHRTPNPGPTALLVPSQDDPQEEVEGLPGGAPPSQDKPPQAAGQAPAVHSLPIQVVSPWSRATPTGPQQTKHADSTQSGDHSLFLNIFKAPLPLLSASNTSV